MRLIRSAAGSRPDNIMSRYKIKIFLEIRGWASTIWLDKCGVEQPLPPRDHRNQYDIFNNLYIRKSNADLPRAILIETRRFFSFFFCLLVIINERGKRIGIMASPLTSWISLIIFIFEEKNIWANLFLKFNALRPLILRLLRVQYLFRKRGFLDSFYCIKIV